MPEHICDVSDGAMHRIQEVIRCKDCLYWWDEDFCNHPQWHEFDSLTRPCTDPDDFCSMAERREP